MIDVYETPDTLVQVEPDKRLCMFAYIDMRVTTVVCTFCSIIGQFQPKKSKKILVIRESQCEADSPSENGEQVGIGKWDTIMSCVYTSG